MNSHKRPGEKPVPRVPMLIATALGAGLCPKAPGTAGTAAGVLVWLVVASLVPIEALEWLMLSLICLFTILGIWSTAVVSLSWGDDPSRVVIDEVVGVWVALMAAPAYELENRVWMALAAFVLFRFFDIVKPLGIKRLDRKQGALWVMADDIVAGIYSLVVLLAVGLCPGWII